MTKDWPEFDFDGESLDDFYQSWMKAHGIDSLWADLSQQDKLSFAVEVIDVYLSRSDKPAVRHAWGVVYDATEHVYPPIPTGDTGEMINVLPLTGPKGHCVDHPDG